jgi:peptidylprolyl isomerase
MATSKRERQKAARRIKMEEMQRRAKRRQNARRGIIVAIVAVVVLGTGALLFAGKSPTTTTTTSTVAPTTTTTVKPVTTSPVAFSPVTDPSPAGTRGKATTVVVPPGAPPTKPELANLITGTGPGAVNGDTLTVQYELIQSSWTSQSFTFTLGVTSLIPGWVDGMYGMKQGGRRELILPPALGYGDLSPGAGITKNDTLVFVIDLLKLKAA